MPSDTNLCSPRVTKLMNDITLCTEFEAGCNFGTNTNWPSFNVTSITTSVWTECGSHEGAV